MNKTHTSPAIAAFIWLLTSAIVGIGWLLYQLVLGETNLGLFFPAIILFSLIGSIPVLIILLILIPWIRRKSIQTRNKFQLLFLACFISIIPYGILGGFLFENEFTQKHNAGFLYYAIL